MKEKEDIFVYAVCGDNIHIETVNFSMRYLKHFSQKKIIVVTDTRRNNIKIDHDNVIDINTPIEFSNHQASIFLKTSLHKHLDLTNNYCYLDSDVIAINNEVDIIFDLKYDVISFAKDHCKLNDFGPYAINCGCSDKYEVSKKEFYDLQKKYYPSFAPDSIFTSQEARQLYCDLYRVKQNPISNFHIIFKYVFQKIIFPFKYFNLNKNFKYDKKNKVWLNNKDEFVMSDILGARKDIENNSDFRFDRFRKYWKDKNGNDIFKLQCNHLQEEIFKKCKQKIQPDDWQHWNGGVFLFNNKSKFFLDKWHNLTMAIFEDSHWKTRDQGTLATTVWEFNLQNQKPLPSEFNFIADFYKPEISYSKGKGFTTDNFNTSFKPIFIHIYHHFGDENWNIWRYVKKLI